MTESNSITQTAMEMSFQLTDMKPNRRKGFLNFRVQKSTKGKVLRRFPPKRAWHNQTVGFAKLRTSTYLAARGSGTRRDGLGEEPVQRTGAVAVDPLQQAAFGVDQGQEQLLEKQPGPSCSCRSPVAPGAAALRCRWSARRSGTSSAGRGRSWKARMRAS